MDYDLLRARLDDFLRYYERNGIYIGRVDVIVQSIIEMIKECEKKE